jgi:hypothetical protein
MYGIILESIKTSIEDTFGNDIWNMIVDDINLGFEEIDFYKLYPDDLVKNIIKCKILVLNFNNLMIFYFKSIDKNS